MLVNFTKGNIMNLENVNPYLRIDEACSLIGVSKTTFRKFWSEEKGFPKGKKLGNARVRVWSSSELLRWVERQGS
jgi:predicted DNA-binding transcriptional regulator AlpA